MQIQSHSNQEKRNHSIPVNKLSMGIVYPVKSSRVTVILRDVVGLLGICLSGPFSSAKLYPIAAASSCHCLASSLLVRAGVGNLWLASQMWFFWWQHMVSRLSNVFSRPPHMIVLTSHTYIYANS